MRLLCLGIESTAHTFGASIVTDDGGILSDVKSVYVAPAGSGIHPREAAQHHGRVVREVIKRAFEEARVKPKDLSAVAVALGPGLGPCLRVGATAARAMAITLNVPLVPVHHAIGHIEIGALTSGAKDPLVVLVSGGHTTIAAFAAGRWRVFGETEDITLGNLIEMFAREAKIQPPPGQLFAAPTVAVLASKGKNFIELPYTVKGNDVSYSGLFTMAVKKLNEEGVSLEDLCHSLQEVAFSMLAEAVERSLAYTEKKELLLTGGVAASKVLQDKLSIVAKEHGAKFYVVDQRYTGDCGAQIAWAGMLAFKRGITIDVEKSFVRPKWRLDEVDIPWRSEGDAP